MFDLFEHVEHGIHDPVRHASPSAQPPVLECSRLGPTKVVIRYRSQRRLCAVAKGLIAGITAHYCTPIGLNETTCMAQGAACCTLSIAAAA